MHAACCAVCCVLQVGNGDLASTQQRAHFALWSLAKSPLLISTDLGKISNISLDILKAEEVRGGGDGQGREREGGRRVPTCSSIVLGRGMPGGRGNHTLTMLAGGQARPV